MATNKKKIKRKAPAQPARFAVVNFDAGKSGSKDNPFRSEESIKRYDEAARLHAKKFGLPYPGE